MYLAAVMKVAEKKCLIGSLIGIRNYTRGQELTTALPSPLLPLDAHRRGKANAPATQVS